MLQINSQQLYDLLVSDPRTLIIDVRFADERAELGYIKNSHPIPLYLSNWDQNPAFVDEIDKIAAPDTPLVFVCRSGNRSCIACDLAQNKGYSAIYNLSEGYSGLVSLKSGTLDGNEVDLLDMAHR